MDSIGTRSKSLPKDDWEAIALASFHHYAATRKEPILRNGPLYPPQGRRRSHWVPGGRIVLGKQRILEIYLNVVEWGPGIYGAESACRYYDETAAGISPATGGTARAILRLP